MTISKERFDQIVLEVAKEMFDCARPDDTRFALALIHRIESESEVVVYPAKGFHGNKLIAIPLVAEE